MVAENMRLSGTPQALFCVSNSWASPFRVGSRHLAEGLASKGWKIAFVSDPVMPLHLLKINKKEIRERFKLCFGSRRRISANIWAWTPFAAATPRDWPFFRSRLLSQNWHNLVLPGMKNSLAIAGFKEFDLVYVDSPLQAYWHKPIKRKKTIFRLADNISAFPDRRADFIKTGLQNICQNADYVLYTSLSLAPLAGSLTQNKSLYFPNGVNFAHFAAAAPIPKEYADARPKVVYAGSFGPWFLWSWVRDAASQLPDALFYLIGPGSKTGAKNLGLANVTGLGPRSYEQLPGYFQHANAGIIPFDQKGNKSLVDDINPLKLYEYLASGLPVVASSWQTLKNLNPPVKLCASVNDFIAALSATLTNKTANRKELQAFARNFDWQNNIATLEKLIFY